MPGLFEQIAVSPAVRDEVTGGGVGAADLARAPWLRVHSWRDADAVERLAERLQRGEAETIVLALELDALLLIDDLDARRLARRLNVEIAGTLALLVRAKRRGLIGSIRPLTSELVSAGVRLSPKLIAEVLASAGEDA